MRYFDSGSGLRVASVFCNSNDKKLQPFKNVQSVSPGFHDPSPPIDRSPRQSQLCIPLLDWSCTEVQFQPLFCADTSKKTATPGAFALVSPIFHIRPITSTSLRISHSFSPRSRDWLRRSTFPTLLIYCMFSLTIIIPQYDLKQLNI
jgi:hypothetical protein